MYYRSYVSWILYTLVLSVRGANKVEADGGTDTGTPYGTIVGTTCRGTHPLPISRTYVRFPRGFSDQ
jgi:hypothetical protein